jgi:hypothetical protein
MGIPQDQFLKFSENMTHRKRLSTLAEVADTAVFLASDKASGITGTVAVAMPFYYQWILLWVQKLGIPLIKGIATIYLQFALLLNRRLRERGAHFWSTI